MIVEEAYYRLFSQKQVTIDTMREELQELQKADRTALTTLPSVFQLPVKRTRSAS